MPVTEIGEAKSLHYLSQVVTRWRSEYPLNAKHDLVFQNKATLTNVIFTGMSLHAIEKHSRGFENIPQTVMNPDELWSLWEDPDKQMVVMRYYISFGPACYVVKTRDGIIMDAFACTPSAANKYRRGVIL